MKTLILRLEVDETGRVLGVVERVRTGEKERFLGYPMLENVVRHLVEIDNTPPVRTTHAASPVPAMAAISGGPGVCRHARNSDLLGARRPDGRINA